MHAVSCIGAMPTSGGGAALHSATTNGQRGAKAQPGARLERLGGWPAIELNGSPQRAAAWHRIEQAKRVGVARPLEDLRDRPGLGNAAGIHHRQPVAGLRDDAEIVRDQHDAHVEVAPQPQDQLQDLVLDGDVERGGGLVRQQELRLGRQGDGDHRALPHAAGELVRIILDARLGRRNADQVQQLDRPRLPRRAVEIGVFLEILADLRPDGEDRIERAHRLLEDHRDLPAPHAAHLRLGHPQHIAAAPQHLAADPRRRFHQAQDGAQGQALARAGFAGKAHHLARTDVEIDAVDGGQLVARCPESHAQAAHRQQRLRHLRRAVHRRLRNRSARPSPNMLKETPATTMAMPGKTDIHQPVFMKFLPSAIRTPHSAVGGCAPRPR